MDYYDNAQAYHDRGIDYDLYTCLEYNPQDGFTVDDIAEVLAVWEGENDEDDWRWVLRLHDGRFVFLQGGCDYTGWDCQSWASHVIRDTAEDAARGALGEVPIDQSSPAQAGLGHMLTILLGEYNANNEEVYSHLLAQIKTEKRKTWGEQKDEEFGLVDNG